MRTPGLIALGDLDLERRGRRRAWEPVASAAQVVVSVLGAPVAAMALGAHPSGVEWVVAAFASVIGSVAVWAVIERLRRWMPIHAYRRELAFRRWRAGHLPSGAPRELRLWSRRVMREDASPDWLLCLRGATLPVGGASWVRAEIHAERRATSRLVFVAEGRAGGAGDAASGEARALTDEEVEGFLGLLVGFPASLKSFPRWEVMDGLPCDLTITRKTPLTTATVELNLAARAGDTDEPSVALVRRMLDLGRGKRGRPVAGWTDARGNVTVGPV